MNSIMVDRLLGQRFLAAHGEVELIDESGIVVAIANISHPTESSNTADWPSDQEIERRLRDGKEHSTEDVLLHLQKLEATVHGR